MEKLKATILMKQMVGEFTYSPKEDLTNTNPEFIVELEKLAIKHNIIDINVKLDRNYGKL